MKTDQKLILITDFIEQKLRKEKELEFYLEELEKLNRKIGFLRGEVNLTNTIINMIKGEQIYDIKDNMIENDNILSLSESGNKNESWKRYKTRL